MDAEGRGVDGKGNGGRVDLQGQGEDTPEQEKHPQRYGGVLDSVPRSVEASNEFARENMLTH